MDNAACRNFSPEIFKAHPGQHRTKRTDAAVAICEKCPVWTTCLEFGLLEEFEIFGGFLPLERAQLKNRRKAANGR